MNCSIIRDLLPLYVDGCCSDESVRLVKEHLEACPDCRALHKTLTADVVDGTSSPLPTASPSRINDWKASVLQSALLFVSFAIITIGVSLEAYMLSGIMNGFYAFTIVVPATGFMLSLANWYFVRLYKSKRSFSNCSCLLTIGITLIAALWAVFHYADTPGLYGFLESLISQLILCFRGLYFIGVMLTVIFSVLSKALSAKFARMIGKE